MRIDQTHHRWMQVTLGCAAVAAAAFVPYAMRSQYGPRGGSFIGLTFGVLAYGLMLFAGLLGARKKVPVWRLGRAQNWLRGHLWLGALSLLLVFFHSGFRMSGPLGKILTLLSILVVGGGILGAALQHYLPSVMTERVPLETIYQEIPQIRSRLQAEADQIVTAICASPISALSALETANREQFREIYAGRIQPFLAGSHAAASELSSAERSARTFQTLRKLVPPPLHNSLAELEAICEEQRQLHRQVTLYRWMHGWLLVHVPLSIVLLVLVAAHALMALRY